MNEENTKKIINACPSLFVSLQNDDNILQNLIVFGFECGDGWSELLIELCQKIKTRLDELDPETAKHIVATQVKEKYGTLRFYLSYYDEVIDQHIKEAQEKSKCTCEICGAPGKLRGEHWFYVSCDLHKQSPTD